MDAVREAVYGLTDLGVVVLSPADPRVVDQFGEFLFVASDRLRTIRLVQQRHLAAIEASDFLWLVDPDGYVGTSASMEIGYAVAVETPVFATTPPNDLTLRNYVQVVDSQLSALRRLRERDDGLSPAAILDTDHAIDLAERHLEIVRSELIRPADRSAPKTAPAAEAVREALRSL
jgi:nucleoside 2-deoxyribosyltransferase